MKRFLFFFLLFVSLGIYAKEYRLSCKVDGVNIDGPYYENDSVRFDFEYRAYSPHFLNVRIKNKMQKRITIEWENARLGDSQICFGSDNVFSYNNHKPEEVIHAGSQLEKEIGEREDPEYRSLVFYESSIKKYGRSVVSVIIPVRYPSGRIEDTEIYLILEYK